jgi:hypothetical protein
LKQKVIIHGEVHRKLYKFDRYKDYFGWSSLDREPQFYETTGFLKKAIIWEGEIDNPPLEINEKLYISDLDETVIIIDRSRNSSGGYIYLTEFILEVIEDEETIISKINAESSQKNYLIQQEVQKQLKSDKEKHIQKYVGTLTDYNKKWYQFLK